jgi:hypothetical protein
MSDLKPVTGATTSGNKPVSAAVMTEPELEALLKSSKVVEPKGGAKLSMGLRVLGTLNRIANLHEKREVVEKVTPPDERLIVLASPNQKGKMEIDFVFRGQQQPDGSLRINQARNAQFHYTMTVQDNDKETSRALTLPPVGARGLSAQDVKQLHKWERDINSPSQESLEQAKGTHQGYATGSPYDAPSVQVPQDLPPIPASLRNR